MNIFLKLFFVFFRIGLFGFGGGLAMLPMIYQGASEFQLMEKGEFANLVAISQITPGPISVNAATYVGFNSEGLLGALTATAGVAIPAFMLVSITYFFLEKFKESKKVQGAIIGIKPITCGFLASGAFFIGKSAFTLTEWIPISIFAVSLVLIFSKKVSPFIVLIISGVLGAFLCG